MDIYSTLTKIIYHPAYWVVAGIFSLGWIIWAYFYFFEKDKFEVFTEERKNKIALYIFYVLSALVLILPILFLLASLSTSRGGSGYRKRRKTCPRCHRYWRNCRC